MTTSSPRVRLVGLDVARCLALLGMMATHVYPARDASGELTLAQELSGGRASALFAVLAGVTLALLTGGRTPPRGRELAAGAVQLAVRALLIAALGMVLGGLGTGLAIILTYYGLLFCLGIAFLRLSARWLAGLAAAWLIVGPALAHLVRPQLPRREFASPTFDQLVADPLQMLSELTFTGYYPVVPWLAYMLAGMALGRIDLTRRAVQVGIAVVGAGLAVAAHLVSRMLTAREDVMAALLGSPGTPYPSGPQLLDEISEGMFGTTPPEGPWQWLLVDAPHSATPFDLAATTGSSLLVLGLGLLIVGLLRPVGRRAVALFFGAGTMTLTLYSLHAVMRTEEIWPAEDPDTYAWHVLVVLGIGLVAVALGRRGPAEAFVSAASKGWAARLVGRPASRG